MPSRFLHLICMLPFAVSLSSDSPAGKGELGRPPLALSVVQRDSVHAWVTIRDARQRTELLDFHLPEFVSVFNDTEPNLTRTVKRDHRTGSVAVTGGTGARGDVRFAFLLKSGVDYVDIDGTVTNLGTRPFNASAFLGTCLDVRRAPPLANDSGAKIFVVDGDSLTAIADSEELAVRDEGTGSLIVRSSTDGKRHAALAWSDAWSVGADTAPARQCIRSNPFVGALPPGETRRLRGRVYVVDGSVDDLFRRFVNDFPNLGHGESEDDGLQEPFLVSAITDGEKVTVTVSSLYGQTAANVRLYRKTIPYLAYTGPKSRVRIDTSGSRQIDEAEFGGDSVVAFTDNDVHFGEVLGYWVGVNDYDSGIVTVRVRDPRVMWGPEEVDEAIDDVFKRFAGRVRVRTHGKTVDGWPLRSVSAGNPDRMFAIVGGIHPGEAGAEYLLPVFERIVDEDRDLLDSVGVAVLPLLNGDTRKRLADGHATYLRGNANGVDLNRNFDSAWNQIDIRYKNNTASPSSITYRGPYPNSEPETRAAIDFVETFHPALFLSMHGPGSLFVTPRLHANRLSAELHETARFLIDAYAGEDSIPKASEMMSQIPGTLSRWVADKFGVPAYDQENDGSPESLQFNEHAMTRETLDTFQKRNYRMWRRILERLSE